MILEEVGDSLWGCFKSDLKEAREQEVHTQERHEGWREWQVRYKGRREPGG